MDINPLDLAPDSDIVAKQKLAAEQLNIDDHDVMNTSLRKDKTIIVETDEDDGAGGKKTTTKIEDVNRIPIPLQKVILKRRVAFMNVKNTKISATPDGELEKRLLAFVTKIRDDNKIQYKEVQLAKLLLSDLQAAKLYYFEETDRNNYPRQNNGASKLRMRMKVLSPSLGDTLIPVFDDFGTMVMFIRNYMDADDSEISEVFTSEEIMVFKNKELVTERSGPNLFGKIPVIYYEVGETPWNDVQPMISRLETLMSNFADTCDYNGAPIMVATGVIEGFSTRGERGKTFQMEEGAELKYVSWDSAPEAIRLEIEKLIEFIFSCSQTPNTSFEQMKGLGGLSGVGMDRVFLDAQLAAADVIDGGYGESTQRDINLQMAGAVFIDATLQEASEMDIWFELEPYRFDDVAGTVTMLVQAYQGGLISRKTAIEQNPLVDGNAELEYDRIIDESSRSIEEVEEEEEV